MGRDKVNGSTHESGGDRRDQTLAEFVMELLDSLTAHKAEPKAYSARELVFLHRILFANLQYVSADVDGNTFHYFSAADFLRVIDRCEVLGVELIGVCVYSKNAELPQVVNCDDHGLDSARAVVMMWQNTNTPNVLFCGSYGISQALLNLFCAEEKA